MANNDTTSLLKECNSGVKMGVASLQNVIGHVKNQHMKKILISCKETHERLGNETHELLNKYHKDDEEPSPMAKSMSWLKTNLSLAIHDSDQKIANLITDGCNMGIKSLNMYLNQYKGAEETVKDITSRLINSEKKLVDDLTKFL